MDTQSPTHKKNDGETPENDVKNDVENMVSNIPDDNIGNPVSDDEHVHEDVKAYTIVALVDFVNKNDEKKKSANKNKTKVESFF